MIKIKFNLVKEDIHDKNLVLSILDHRSLLVSSFKS
jgi:hypothetical protein